MEGNLSKYALIFLVLALSGVIFLLQNIHTLEVRKDPAFMLLDRQKEGGSREVMLLLLIKLNLLLLLCGATSLKEGSHNSKVLTKCLWIIDCCCCMPILCTDLFLTFFSHSPPHCRSLSVSFPVFSLSLLPLFHSLSLSLSFTLIFSFISPPMSGWASGRWGV